MTSMDIVFKRFLSSKLPRNLSSTESSQDEEPLQFREVEELPWLEQKQQEVFIKNARDLK